MNPEATALRILTTNKHAVLSTASKQGEPWASAVAFTIDNAANFYWTSARNTKHSRLVAENHSVAVCVIDAAELYGGGRQKEFGSAVYALGVAQEIPYSHLAGYIKWRYPEGKRKVEDFDPNTQHRAVYRLTTRQMWCLAEPEIINGVKTDKRVPVDLEALKEALKNL